MTPVRSASCWALALVLASAPLLRAADAPAPASATKTPTAASASTAPEVNPSSSTSGLAPTQGKAAARDPVEVAADVLVARPAGLAATVVGSAIFVVALPFAAIAGDVKETGRALVGSPARWTFQRRLGELSSI